MSKSHVRLRVHIVFGVKERQRLLTPALVRDIRDVSACVLARRRMFLIAASGAPDHMHFLVSARPKFSVADIVRLIKANTSRRLNQMQRFDQPFRWQAGYGAFSVSDLHVPMVVRYIESHMSRWPEEPRLPSRPTDVPPLRGSGTPQG